MSAKSAFLVVGPSWVGDMVMAQSLFTTLKNNNPDVEIDVVAPAWSVGLLKRMPEIRKGYALNVAHGELGLLKRYRLGRQLKANHYQRAIVLPRSFKSALIPYWAGIAMRTGFKTEMRYGLLNDLRILDKAKLNQTVKRFVALGLGRDTEINSVSCPQPALQLDESNKQQLMIKLALSVDKPIVGFMPGAEYGPAKQWPIKYFIELAKRLGEQQCGIWIFGSKKEQPLGDQISQAAGEHAVNLCGKTSLVDVIDLCSQLSAAVSNDSGLMHLAAAVGCPIVAIYGSSSPVFTPPLTQQAKIEYLQLECSPCFKRHCPLEHNNCLNHISVEQVQKSIFEFLK